MTRHAACLAAGDIPRLKDGDREAAINQFMGSAHAGDTTSQNQYPLARTCHPCSLKIRILHIFITSALPTETPCPPIVSNPAALRRRHEYHI